MIWIIVGAVFFLWVIGASLAENEKDKKQEKPTVFCGTPFIQAQQPQPMVPGGEARQWTQYALNNPEVKLQVVEKLEVANGQFTAEKHMKMTGPVRPQRPAVKPYFTY
jgi:hypothetical protein